MEFEKFSKIPRYSRDCIITEKIDGTNGQIAFDEDMNMYVGSRNRWLSEEQDNHGFYKWAKENEEELRKLGVGRHFGEWWGKGINRNYGLDHNKFSLFNVRKWERLEDKPKCCDVVPVIIEGPFEDKTIHAAMDSLQMYGSYAAKGFKDPEGIVIYHKHSGHLFKKTIHGDEMPKHLMEELSGK